VATAFLATLITKSRAAIAGPDARHGATKALVTFPFAMMGVSPGVRDQYVGRVLGDVPGREGRQHSTAMVVDETHVAPELLIAIGGECGAESASAQRSHHIRQSGGA
jgi:hypothetical protein